MGGNVSNVQIGPGNLFTGIAQGSCGSVHCDAIQGYGAGSGIVIEGNRFEKGDTFIMMPDGSNGVAVRGNEFDGTGNSYTYKLQFGSARNLVYTGNTNRNASVAIDSKTGQPASTNAQATGNTMIGSHFKTSGGNGCSGCTIQGN
jgi:hypothetical protein